MSFLFSQPAPGVLPANSVDFSEVETIASNTLLGNNTGSDSVILELSKTQATAMLDVMGAASAGSGGLKGLVPASSAGDQAKFLRADATWATVDLSNLANRNLSNLSEPTAVNRDLNLGVNKLRFNVANGTSSISILANSDIATGINAVTPGNGGTTVINTSADISSAIQIGDSIYLEGLPTIATVTAKPTTTQLTVSVKLGFSGGGQTRQIFISPNILNFSDTTAKAILTKFGEIQLSDGSVSKPVYSFASNSSMGFYKSGTNLIYTYDGVDRAIFGITGGGGSGTFFVNTLYAPTISGAFPYSQFSLNNIAGLNITAISVQVGGADDVTFPLNKANLGLAINASSYTSGYRRFSSIHALSRMSIGYSPPGGVSNLSPGTLNVRARSFSKHGLGNITTIDSGTTLSYYYVSGNTRLYEFAGPGDYVTSSGSPGVIAKILSFVDINTMVVDTPLNAGILTFIPNIASFQKSDGNTALEIDYNGIVSTNFGEKHKSLHAQAGTLDVITVTTSDYYIGVDTSSAAKTVNLPAAATAGQGFVLVIKDESGNAATRNITIDANASELIDGALTQVINTNYGSVSLMCSGSAWFIM